MVSLLWWWEKKYIFPGETITVVIILEIWLGNVRMLKDRKKPFNKLSLSHLNSTLTNYQWLDFFLAKRTPNIRVLIPVLFFFRLTLGKLKSPREKKFNIKTMPTPGTIAISLLSACLRSSCISPSPNQYIVPVPRDLKTHMSIEKYGKYVDVWEKKTHGHFTMYIKNIFSKNYLLQLILLNYAKIVCRTEEGHSAFEAALHDTWMLLHEIPSQTRAIQYIL